VRTINAILSVALLGLVQNGFAQGFVNLNFDSANLSGYSRLDFVPITNALPGWTAYPAYPDGTIVYDGISTGGAGISIVDTNVALGSGPAPGFYPFQGRYSVCLFGANGVSETISQTGMVPTARNLCSFMQSLPA
jgi:hypothetical protein